MGDLVEVTGGQRIIMAGEVVTAYGDADACGASRRLRQQVQVGEPPIAGGEQGAMDGAYGARVCRSARGPRGEHEREAGPALPDRKSTRLNSSHLGISYAVFCLKKNITITPSAR